MSLLEVTIRALSVLAALQAPQVGDHVEARRVGVVELVDRGEPVEVVEAAVPRRRHLGHPVLRGDVHLLVVRLRRWVVRLPRLFGLLRRLAHSSPTGTVVIGPRTGVRW